MKAVRCDECGKKITPGTRVDGLPNGVGFQLADGSIYNVCTECLIRKGEEDAERKHAKADN